MGISACWDSGNSQFLVYFRMWKCTILCEFPHVGKRASAWVDLQIFLYISTSGNSLKRVPKRVQIRICRNTLFLMREFTLNSNNNNNKNNNVNEKLDAVANLSVF